MNKQFDLGVLLKLIDNFTKPLSGIGKKIAVFSKKITAAGKKISSFGKTLIQKVTLPLGIIGGMAIKSAADIETLTVAFESMTGSTELANKTVKDLINFTAKTPFQLQGVGKAGKQLLSFGVSTDDLLSKLKFLGDIAAGANVPLSDMASIFGKSKAKGKAMTEELLQLSDRGIPIIQVLSDELGVSKDKIFEMASKSKISFKILEKAMIKMTKKGGVFADQMKKQSATLNGIFSTLKDNIQLALAELGNFIIKEFDLKKVMSDLIVKIQKAVAAFKIWVKENPKLAKLILKLALFAAALGAILVVLGPLIVVFGKLIPLLWLIVKVLGALLIAGGPILWIITAIALAAILIIKYWKPLKKFFKKLWKGIVGIFFAHIKQVKKDWKSIIGFFVGNKSVFKSIGNGFFAIFMPFIGIPALIIKNWEKLVGFFKNLWKRIDSIMPSWIKKLYNGFKGEIKTTNITKDSKQIMKSQTEIKIKLSSADGSVATIENIKRKRGTAKVNISTQGFLGRTFAGGM